MKLAIAVIFMLSPGSLFAEYEHYLAGEIKIELKSFITKRLSHDYDVKTINLLDVKAFVSREISLELKRTKGLVELIKVHAEFEATRNSHDSENCLKRSKMRKYDYLHCGVMEGHIFQGELEFFVTRTNGSVAILCQNCIQNSSYPLFGYLILGGRGKEGYVWYP